MSWMPTADMPSEAVMADGYMTKLKSDKEPKCVRYCILDDDSSSHKVFYLQRTKSLRTRNRGWSSRGHRTEGPSLGQKRAVTKVPWSSDMFPEIKKLKRDKLITTISGEFTV